MGLGPRLETTLADLLPAADAAAKGTRVYPLQRPLHLLQLQFQVPLELEGNLLRLKGLLSSQPADGPVRSHRIRNFPSLGHALSQLFTPGFKKRAEMPDLFFVHLALLAVVRLRAGKLVFRAYRLPG
jgi:hypothetical protein